MALILLILLIGIVIVLYAVVPVIVRSTIGKAQLAFRSVNIEQMEKDRFRLRGELELSRTGSLPGTILAPLVITVDDVGTITHNQPISITGDSSRPTVVLIDSTFLVSSLEAFHNFSRSLIFEANVTWHLTAAVTVRPLWRPMLSYSKIPFNKDVTFTALHGLSHVTIDSIRMNRSTADRILADLTITMANPSIFTIDLGELNFDLLYKNWSIGHVESVSQNLTLRPGLNTIAFLGELQSNSSEAYQALSTVIQNYLTGQTSDVEVLAGPNATSYPLLAVGLMGLSLSVPMGPYKEQLIESVVFESMALIPSVMEKTVLLSASMVIEVNSPLGDQSPLEIQLMDMSAALLYQDESVGVVNVTRSAVRRLNSNTYQTHFADRVLALTGTGATYEQFCQNFIRANQSNPIHCGIEGSVSIVGSYALGPLTVDGITVSNDVSLVGFDGLSNVYVDGISVDGEVAAALRLTINATIENSGVTDIQLQNFTFQLAEDENGTVLGQMPIDIFQVHPGSNEVTLHGLVAALHESDVPALSRFFSAYLNNQTQAVKLFHESSSLDNATAMDLTISGLSMRSHLDGIETRLIRRIEVLNFGIDFDPIAVNKVYVTGTFQVGFELPSNIHMTFKALTTTISLIVRFVDGAKIGQMNLYDMPVEHNQTTNEILMTFDKQELHVLDDTAFEQFAADLLQKSDVSVMIEGLTTAVVQTRIGNLTLSDIPMQDTIYLTGFDQFDHGRLHIGQIDVVGARSSLQLVLRVKTIITNPSVVNIIEAGRLTLDLCDLSTNTSVGLVNIDPFHLDPQENETIIDAEGILTITRENNATARQFVSRMVSGIDSEVELRGASADNSTGTSVPLLAVAVAGLNIHATVPGLAGDQTLIREIILKKLTAAQIAGIPLGLVKTLLTRIRIVNPFSTAMIIQKLDIRADFSAIVDEDKQVGVVNDSTPLIIGPHQDMITSYYTVHLTAKLGTMVSLLVPLFAGTAHLSLVGTFDVTIGDQFVLNQLPFSILNISSIQDSGRHRASF